MGRPPGADADATRQRIVETATERFAQQGYSETPVSVVAADAGLTSGTLYHYFPSKSALYEEVAVKARRELAERLVDPVLDAVRREPELDRRLLILVEALVERADEDLTLHRLGFASDLDAGNVDVVETFHYRIRDDLARVYAAVAGVPDERLMTVEERELVALVETLTLGIMQFAMRPNGLERLPLIAEAMMGWLGGTLLDRPAK